MARISLLKPDPVVVPADNARITIPITGMSCAACQAHVQKALQNQPGVADAAVNLMTREATVDLRPRPGHAGDLVEAVRATGYGAELPPPRTRMPADRPISENCTNIAACDCRAIVSLIAGVVAMIVSVPLMAGHTGATADPLMQRVTAALSPLVETRVALAVSHRSTKS